MNKPLFKSILLLISIFAVVSISFTLTVLLHKESSYRINYSLITHEQIRVTQKHFSGRYQLVLFGFTSCNAVCPIQMNKLSKVVKGLDKSGYGNLVVPLLISVDPERDTPEIMKEYLSFFHPNFVGLTGSRKALQSTADSFKTLLSNAPLKPEGNYQITHSSVVYLLDPFNRIIDFLPFSLTAEEMTQKIRSYL